MKKLACLTLAAGLFAALPASAQTFAKASVKTLLVDADHAVAAE